MVGVVATARYREIDNPRFDLYVPLRQAESDVQHFTIRTAIDPLRVAPSIAAELALFDKALVMEGVTTMEDIVGRTRGPWRFNMLVFGMFGAVALALAGVGLFGVVAQEVAQRTREIGLRMALGAARGHVVRLMVSQGAKPAAIGLAIGIARLPAGDARAVGAALRGQSHRSRHVCGSVCFARCGDGPRQLPSRAACGFRGSTGSP